MRTSKANAAGRREDLRLLASPFARAVEDLRAAIEPAAAAERVVSLVPHQVNRRLQVLAAVDHRRAGRRPAAGAAMVARYASAVAVEDGAVARLFGGE